MATAAVLLTAYSRHVLEQQAATANLTVAHFASLTAREHIEDLTRFVDGFARRPALLHAVANRDESALAQLAEFIGLNPRIQRAFITDGEGVLWCDQPCDPAVHGKSFAFRDWYRGVTGTHATYVSAVYRRMAAPPIDLVAVATPLQSATGDRLGFLVAQYPLSSLAGWLTQVTPASAGRIALFDHHGRLAAVTGSAEVPADETDEPLIPRTAPATGSTVGSDPLSHESSLLGWATVEPFGWRVMASQPTSAVLAPADRLERTLLGLAVLAFGAMLAVGWLWLRTIRRYHTDLGDIIAMRDLLTGMITHDLRNPLTAISGSIELLRARQPSPSQAPLLENAHQSAQRLLESVSQLVDIGRMEDKQLPLQLESTDLVALVRHKSSEYGAAAALKGLMLTASVPDRPVIARVDAPMLGRVLENLLTNAIKHTPPGGTITLGLAPGSGNAPLRLWVQDTGEGIPEAFQQRIFQKYGLVQLHRTGNARDTGLGLLFCRLAMELHGGRIELQSRSGQGSTFQLLLPLAT